ncbi:MAG: hypothetical protein ABIO79_02750 [Ferruginibacter sp.]
MKSFFLFLMLIPVCYSSFSQGSILEKKSKIKKRVESYYQETKRKYTISETDSTLAYTLTDSLTLPATYVYYFNEQNRCEKQETIYSCDSCMQNGMQESLNNRSVNWQKVGPKSYYAGFPYYRLMEQVKTNGLFILRFSKQKRKEVKKDISQL